MSMHSFEDSEWSDYYIEFENFVDKVKSGRFTIILSVEYSLAVGFETVWDTITVSSSPQILTFPLNECYERCVESFIESSLRRFDDPVLVGLTFKWSNVDGICSADVASSS